MGTNTNLDGPSITFLKESTESSILKPTAKDTPINRTILQKDLLFKLFFRGFCSSFNILPPYEEPKQFTLNAYLKS